MIRSIWLFGLVFCLDPDARGAPDLVLVLRDGQEVVICGEVSKRDGRLVFADRQGNHFSVPLAWVAQVKTRKNPPPLKVKSEPGRPSLVELVAAGTNMRAEPLVVTDDTLKGYSAPVSSVGPLPKNPQKHQKEARSAAGELQRQAERNAEYRVRVGRIVEEIEVLEERERGIIDGMFMVLDMERRDQMEQELRRVREQKSRKQAHLSAVRQKARRAGAKARH